jgi:hypothetical protein
LLQLAFEVCIALAIFAYLALPPKNSHSSARAPAMRGLILAMSGGFVVPWEEKTWGSYTFKCVWNPALFGTGLFMPFESF